jgi:hypothetical protein
MLRFRTPAAKARADARQEAAQQARTLARMARPIAARDDNRLVGRLLLDIGSTIIDLELRPDPRDVRRWYAYINGEPYCHAGLERIWRKVQSEIAPPLGREHWR